MGHAPLVLHSRRKSVEMTQQYARLSPLAFAIGFAAAALVGMTLSFLPMQFSMFAGHGYGMMGGSGYLGGAFAFFVCLWVLAVSALAGAVTAVVYNALLPRESPNKVRDVSA